MKKVSSDTISTRLDTPEIASSHLEKITQKECDHLFESQPFISFFNQLHN
ncbi:MAG: hypothetical protein LBD11_05735 [Candidatus Peribacteria bacterium]|nr:hypothetical protein [Candidatus Peribacteria bacterium]